MSPKLSIVVPTFNRGLMIGELILSIYAQPFRDLEIVVVDDGSTDDTREVIVQYQAIAPMGMELIYVRQNNGGAASARNLGFSKSRGCYVMFADSDDRFAEMGIATGVRKLGASSLDYIYMKVVMVDSNWQPIESPLKGGEYDGSDYQLISHHWHTMAAIYRRSLLEAVGPWREDFRCSEDWEFQVRVKLIGRGGLFIDSIMGYWRLHDQERLSVQEFSRNYVASVHEVCLAIGSSVENSGRMGPTIQRRLFNRLLRHALESGANGDRNLRSTITGSCLKLAPGKLETLIIFIIRTVNLRSSDRLLYRMLDYSRPVS